MPSRTLDFLLVLTLLVVVSVVSAGLAFRDAARWIARREVRRYLDEHPPLPELERGGDE
ncbi:MAG: hypothetical protein J0H06_00815 [Actinobacteria bacterium]|nr:hypothetical protein [Actinomycetota bacterium]